MFDNYSLAEILTLLKSLGVNYPIIKDIGYEPTKLFFVIVDSGQMKGAMDLLADRDVTRLSSTMSKKQVEEILVNNNSTYIPYPYVASKKCTDFIEYLSLAVKVGEIAGKKISALPIIISEEIPQGYDMQRFFSIYVNGNLQTVDMDDVDVVPPDEQIAVVLDKIRTVVNEECTPEEKALLSAASFLYPDLVVNGQEENFEKYVSLSKALVIFDDNNQDAGKLKDVFINLLYRWQEKNRFSNVYGLPNLDDKVIKNFESIILYDSDYLYMKDELFKQIAESLLRHLSVGVLKMALTEEGVLCPERVKTYTVKVGYYNSMGEYKRERMLRFDRSELTLLGDLEFVDLCIDIMEGTKC